jgi:hypothetical protein
METRPAGDSAPVAAPEKASIVEDFIEIFYAPSKVFNRRRTSGFGLHLLLVTVLAALFAFATRGVTAQIMDAQYDKQVEQMMKKNPQLTADQLQAGRGIQTAIGGVAVYVGTPIALFILGLFVWLGAKIISANLSYGQSVLIATLAWIPRLLGMLVTALQSVVMDTSTVTNPFALTISPARFLDPDANPPLYAAMGNLEVFGIWCYILIGLGIAVMGNVPRPRGYAVAAVLFIIGSLFTIVPAIMAA